MNDEILKEIAGTLSSLSGLYPTGVPHIRKVRAQFIVKDGEYGEKESELLNNAVVKGLGWRFNEVQVVREVEFNKQQENSVPTVLLGIDKKKEDYIGTVSLPEALASTEKKRIFWNDIKRLIT